MKEITIPKREIKLRSTLKMMVTVSINANIPGVLIIVEYLSVLKLVNNMTSLKYAPVAT